MDNFHFDSFFYLPIGIIIAYIPTGLIPFVESAIDKSSIFAAVLI
jgi:hypothetical protein